MALLNTAELLTTGGHEGMAEEMPGAEELSWALWPRTMGSPETGKGFVTVVYTLFVLHLLRYVSFHLVSLFHNHHVVFHKQHLRCR